MPKIPKTMGYFSVAKRLVDTLTPRENEHFELYLRTELHKANYAKYHSLFKGLQKVKPPLHLIPKLFKDTRALDDGCKHLRTKLIEFVSIRRKHDPLEFALESGFDRYAKIRISKDLRNAVDNQDVYAINKTYLLCRKFGFWPSDKTLKVEHLTEGGFLIEYFVLARAEYLYFLANQYVNQNVGQYYSQDRKVLFDQHVDEIGNLVHPSFFPRTNARLYLVQAIWHLLVRDYEAVQPIMTARLKIMKELPNLFPAKEVFRTSKTLFKVYLASKRFDLISQHLYEMGGLEGPTEIKTDEILGHWFYFSLTQAAAGGDMDLGRVARRSIEQLPDIFYPQEKDLVMVAAAMVAAYEDRWEDIGYLLKKVNQKGFPLHTQVLFLRMISHFEQGEYEKALKQAKPYFKLWRQEIGEDSYGLVESLEHSFSYWCTAEFKGENMEEEASSLLRNFQGYREQEDSRQNFEQSPLIAWLFGKKMNTTIREAIAAHQLSPLLRMGLPEAEA